jgi:hypothetical protein
MNAPHAAFPPVRAAAARRGKPPGARPQRAPRRRAALARQAGRRALRPARVPVPGCRGSEAAWAGGGRGGVGVGVRGGVGGGEWGAGRGGARGRVGPRSPSRHGGEASTARAARPAGAACPGSCGRRAAVAAGATRRRAAPPPHPALPAAPPGDAHSQTPGAAATSRHPPPPPTPQPASGRPETRPRDDARGAPRYDRWSSLRLRTFCCSTSRVRGRGAQPGPMRPGTRARASSGAPRAAGTVAPAGPIRWRDRGAAPRPRRDTQR